MQKLAITLALVAALAAAPAVLACCVTLGAGPTAYVPELTGTGCAVFGVGWVKVTYGGTTRWIADARTTGYVNVSHKAKLYYTKDGSLQETTTAPIAIRCSATTVGSILHTTANCLPCNGWSYYTRYYASFYDCTLHIQDTSLSVSDTAPCS